MCVCVHVVSFSVFVSLPFSSIPFSYKEVAEWEGGGEEKKNGVPKKKELIPRGKTKKQLEVRS